MVNIFNAYKGIEKENFFDSEILSRFIVGSNRLEISAYLNACQRNIEDSCDDFDMVYLRNYEEINFDNTFVNIRAGNKNDTGEDVLLQLLEHAKQCKKFVLKGKCKSILEYNSKYNIKDFCRTIIVIPNLDMFLSSCENLEMAKCAIVGLLKLEKFSGISVVACTSCEFYGVVDFSFINAFPNRVLFKMKDHKIIFDVSLGMYNSTEMLDFNHYYYFNYGALNGKMLSI